MAIKSVRVKATALVPVQQYGAVTLEVEVIAEFGELELGRGNAIENMLSDVHGLLIHEVQGLDPENQAVKAWLKANSAPVWNEKPAA